MENGGSLLGRVEEILANPTRWHHPDALREALASPLLAPEVAWEVLLALPGPQRRVHLEQFALHRQDLEGQAFIRRKRAQALRHLPLEEEDPHLLLWDYSRHLPLDPEEVEVARQVSLSRLAEILAGDPEAGGAVKRLAETLLLMGVGPEGVPEEVWFRLLPRLSPDTLERLTYLKAGWSPLIARVLPDEAHLPPPGHPYREEVAVLSLRAALEEAPGSIGEEMPGLLPKALAGGYWLEALRRNLVHPSSLPPWMAEGLGKLSSQPLLRGALEAFLPEASPEALATLLPFLRHRDAGLLKPHLERLRGGEAHSAFFQALWSQEPEHAVLSLSGLEALGLLDLVMVGGWWRSTILEAVFRDQAIPLKESWTQAELLARLPVPMVLVLLKKTDNNGKAAILKAAGKKLPRKVWEHYANSRTYNLRHAASYLYVQTWYEELKSELERRGMQLPPEEELVQEAEATYAQFNALPFPVWGEGFVLIWSPGKPPFRQRVRLFFASPWGGFGLWGVRGHQDISRPPSLEEALHALSQGLGIPREAVDYLLGLGGEKAARALKALAEGEGELLEKVGSLEGVLAEEELRFLNRILLTQDLLAI